MKWLFIVLALVICTFIVANAQSKIKKYDQYGVEIKDLEPVSTTNRDGFLVFSSEKLNYKLWFDIRVQADFAAFFGNDGDFDKIGNGASIRRARFAVKGQLGKNWYGEIDTDFADGVIELKDAIIRYTGFKGTEISIGNFKEFFSQERNTTSRYLMFMERSMTSEMAPSRHIGINVKYQKDWLWASAGIFSQEIKSSEERVNVEDNNKDYGRSTGLSYTAKLGLRPFRNKPYNLIFTSGISYREPKTDVSTGDYGSARISSRNSTSVNRKKYLDTDDIEGVDHQLLFTGEISGLYKGFRFESAYTGDKFCMENSINESYKYFWGYMVQASYLLFGGNQRYDFAGGKFTRVDPGKDWGDLELCARYDYLDLNNSNIYGGSAEAYTIGLNYHVNSNIKIMLNYQYNNNDRYANGKDKLYVGHDINGDPTKDYTRVAEKDGKAGVDYSMVSMRIQVAF